LRAKKERRTSKGVWVSALGEEEEGGPGRCELKTNPSAPAKKKGKGSWGGEPEEEEKDSRQYI